MLRVAYITFYDARDINQWSGLSFFIKKSLEDQGMVVHTVGNVTSRLRFLYAFKYLYYAVFAKQRYLMDREPRLLKRLASKIQKQLDEIEYDVVFSPGLLSIVYLNTSKPIVVYTDATFEKILEYPECKHLAPESITNGQRVEQIGLARCRAACFASRWAADSAITDYQMYRKAVYVVPFGANLAHEPQENEVRTAINCRVTDHVHLLFVGKDWHRKGGHLSLQIVKHLQSLGYPATLHIVGCEPELNWSDQSYVRRYGFLDKGKEKDSKLLKELYLQSHFFILPSHAEAFGVVYCEANAYGLPCLARSVGGVPTIIKEGVNGFMLYPSESEESYVRKILDVLASPNAYKTLAWKSYQEYQQRLNWNTSGEQLKRIIEDVHFS